MCVCVCVYLCLFVCVCVLCYTQYTQYPTEFILCVQFATCIELNDLSNVNMNKSNCMGVSLSDVCVCVCVVVCVCLRFFVCFCSCWALKMLSQIRQPIMWFITNSHLFHDGITKFGKREVSGKPRAAVEKGDGAAAAARKPSL